MTLEAAAFGGLFRGSLWTMALLAGVNPGQENIGRLAAIGRAIVRNPRFLILDEAMSALDLTLEDSIRRSIQLHFKSRTLLLITHRLDSVRDADHVVCIEDGRVCAEGPPSKVLANSASVRSGSFAR